MPFQLKLINFRDTSLIFSHLCLASAILYMTRHVVNFRLGASRPEFKEHDATENLTRATRVQKTRPRTITRGPKSCLSAHRDPKNKKKFDNANETF